MSRSVVLRSSVWVRALGASLALALTCCAKPPPHVPTGPNPLGDPSTPALPYPSSYFLVQDGTTPTGYRVDLLASVLPRNQAGPAIDPTPFNRFDGFSPATSILLYFPDTPDLTGVAS